MILQRAVRDRLIAANPVPDVNQLPRADDAAAADPFTPAELRAIVRAAGQVDRNLALQLELWRGAGAGPVKWRRSKNTISTPWQGRRSSGGPSPADGSGRPR